MMKLSIAFISFVWAFLFGLGLVASPISANELVSQAPDDARVWSKLVGDRQRRSPDHI